MSAPRPFDSRDVLGTALILGGVSLLYVLLQTAAELVRAWSAAVTSGQSGALFTNCLLLLLLTLFAVAPIVAGVQLFQRRVPHDWMALLAMTPQLVSLAVPGFQYRFCMFALVSMGAAGGEDQVRFGLYGEPGSQALVAFEPLPAWSVQLNIGALALLVLVLLAQPARTTDAAPREPPSPSEEEELEEVSR